jgi:hypothetical protein|tara:strand:- start:1412 stop:1600 length:189 start_codon:yes stop_codon:yes gene_type:complete
MSRYEENAILELELLCRRFESDNLNKAEKDQCVDMILYDYFMESDNEGLAEAYIRCKDGFDQ